MANNAKIVIGVPVADSVAMKARTAHSIGCAIIRTPQIKDFILKISCDVVANRTQLVKEAIASGATHILFVDSDMQFPSDAVTKMLEADKDIVGARYNRRKFPLEPTHIPLEKDSDTELFKCAVIGTGLLLIRLSIFAKMTKDPWFTFGRNAEGETVIGEDYWFSNVAREAGFDIWCDPTIRVVHLGEFGY